MKKIILAFSLCIIILTTVLTVMTVNAKNIRQGELDGSVPEALEAAVCNAMAEIYEDRAYRTEDDEFCADFMEKLCLQTDSTSELEIKFLDTDSVHGLMSTEVTASFSNAGGNTSRLSCIKTAVYEKDCQTESDEYVRLTYTVDSEIYKMYTIRKGCEIIIPENPETERTFLYWTDENGNRIHEGDTVKGSMMFKACFGQ